MKKMILGLALTLSMAMPVYVGDGYVEVKADVEYTEEDIQEIASVVYVEANAETELGQRLVIDVILNRVDNDTFPDTLEGVLTQKNQFSKARKEPTDELVKLVEEEIAERTNDEVLFFKTKKYHSFAKPIVKEGSHYFSGLNE